MNKSKNVKHKTCLISYTYRMYCSYSEIFVSNGSIFSEHPVFGS